MSKKYEIKSMTIAASAQTSSALNVEDKIVVGLVFPPAWTTAVATFQATDGTSGVYNDIYNGGTEVSVPAAQSRAIGFGTGDVQAIQCFPHIRMRSGTAASAVDQTGSRNIKVILRS